MTIADMFRPMFVSLGTYKARKPYRALLVRLAVNLDLLPDPLLGGLIIEFRL
jgi:hypothetical protein